MSAIVSGFVIKMNPMSVLDIYSKQRMMVNIFNKDSKYIPKRDFNDPLRLRYHLIPEVRELLEDYIRMIQIEPIEYFRSLNIDESQRKISYSFTILNTTFHFEKFGNIPQRNIILHMLFKNEWKTLFDLHRIDMKTLSDSHFNHLLSISESILEIFSQKYEFITNRLRFISKDLNYLRKLASYVIDFKTFKEKKIEINVENEITTISFFGEPSLPDQPIFKRGRRGKPTEILVIPINNTPDMLDVVSINTKNLIVNYNSLNGNNEIHIVFLSDDCPVETITLKHEIDEKKTFPKYNIISNNNNIKNIIIHGNTFIKKIPDSVVSIETLNSGIIFAKDFVFPSNLKKYYMKNTEKYMRVLFSHIERDRFNRIRNIIQYQGYDDYDIIEQEYDDDLDWLRPDERECYRLWGQTPHDLRMGAGWCSDCGHSYPGCMCDEDYEPELLCDECCLSKFLCHCNLSNRL
jgi:hypothetical protein